ncbi:hypothetical protein HDU99_010611, partial [Rhizoclosmatium hyalinum]
MGKNKPRLSNVNVRGTAAKKPQKLREDTNEAKVIPRAISNNRGKRLAAAKKVKAVKKIENGFISNKEESRGGINPPFTKSLQIPSDSPVIIDGISSRVALSSAANDSEEPQAISYEDFKILLQNAARDDLDDELGFGFTGFQRIAFAQEQLQ